MCPRLEGPIRAFLSDYCKGLWEHGWRSKLSLLWKSASVIEGFWWYRLCMGVRDSTLKILRIEEVSTLLSNVIHVLVGLLHWWVNDSAHPLSRAYWIRDNCDLVWDELLRAAGIGGDQRHTEMGIRLRSHSELRLGFSTLATHSCSLPTTLCSLIQKMHEFKSVGVVSVLVITEFYKTPTTFVMSLHFQLLIVLQTSQMITCISILELSVGNLQPR